MYSVVFLVTKCDMRVCHFDAMLVKSEHAYLPVLDRYYLLVSFLVVFCALVLAAFAPGGKERVTAGAPG